MKRRLLVVLVCLVVSSMVSCVFYIIREHNVHIFIYNPGVIGVHVGLTQHYRNNTNGVYPYQRHIDGNNKSDTAVTSPNNNDIRENNAYNEYIIPEDSTQNKFAGSDMPQNSSNLLDLWKTHLNRTVLVEGESQLASSPGSFITFDGNCSRCKILDEQIRDNGPDNGTGMDNKTSTFDRTGDVELQMLDDEVPSLVEAPDVDDWQMVHDTDTYVYSAHVDPRRRGMALVRVFGLMAWSEVYSRHRRPYYCQFIMAGSSEAVTCEADVHTYGTKVSKKPIQLSTMMSFSSD